MKRPSAAVALAAALLLPACSGTGEPQNRVAEKQSLDQVVAAAEREGRLDIADSTPPPAFKKIADAFRKKYPSITVNQSTEGGTVIVNKVRQEVEAGSSSVDVFFAGVAPGKQLADEGLLLPVDWKGLGLSDKLILNQWQSRAQGVSTPLIYNKEKVPAADVPKTWDALLDPRWKGKVVVPLDLWGSAAADLATTWGEQRTRDYTKKLKAQRVLATLTPDSVTKVTSGEVPLGVSRAHFARAAIRKGAPIGIQFLNPVPVAMVTYGIPKTAKHPNAAKLWISWLLSPEGQRVYESVAFRGNPWVEGTESAKDIQGLNAPVFTGGDASAIQQRLKREDEFLREIR
jgi:iron(III) transport system substrate-binding protein